MMVPTAPLPPYFAAYEYATLYRLGDPSGELRNGSLEICRGVV